MEQLIVEARFTNDPALIKQDEGRHVKKRLIMIEVILAIEDAIAAFARGDEILGIRLLKQKADTMLTAAIQSEDAELREEAEMIYQYLEQFPQ